MAQILDALHAKTKYVESLTHKNKNFSIDVQDDFLQPIKTQKVIRLTIIEDSDSNNSEKGERAHIDEFQEFLKLLNVIKPKGFVSYVEASEVPEWAKLALASSSPNNKRKIDYY